MLDIYFFILFILGVFQLYILSNIEQYYKQLQTNLLKRIFDSETDIKENIESTAIIEYYNMITHFVIIIGMITPYWPYFLLLYSLIYIGNLIQNGVKITSNNQLNKSLKFSKKITYLIIFLKVLGMFGLGILYFHGLL